MSFAKGGTGVPCVPFYVFSGPLLCRPLDLTVVVGSGGRVYAWDLCVGSSGLVV